MAEKDVKLIKLVVIVSGIILEIAGVVMVFMDYQSQGNMLIRSPVFEGSISATHVGLFVIFLGAVLQCVAILKTYRFVEKKEEVTSQNGHYMYKSSTTEKDGGRIMTERPRFPPPPI